MKPIIRTALAGLFLFAVACGDDSDANSTTNNSNDDPMVDAGMDASGSDTGNTGDTGQPDPFAAERLFELGDYEVGYDEVEFTYQPTGSEEMRTIPVKIWYPAAPESGAAGASYQVGGIVNVPTEIALDAPPINEEGPFPLAIYSHGFGGEGLLAYPYAEFFASHGWVTISPNHVGNTALDALLGNLIAYAQVVLWRYEDIVRMMDAAETGFGDEALAAGIDMERVLLYGHSFGGYTTLAVGGADVSLEAMQATCVAADDQPSCTFLEDTDVAAAFNAGFGDDRVDAIVPQAPAAFGIFADGEIADGIDVPTMVQTADNDQTTTLEAQSRPTWEALDGPDDIWVRMPTGGHYTFITICDDLSDELLMQFRDDAPEDGCNDTFIPVSEAVPVLNAYLYGFANVHVLGVTEWTETIEGMPLDERFTVETK